MTTNNSNIRSPFHMNGSGENQKRSVAGDVHQTICVDLRTCFYRDHAFMHTDERVHDMYVLIRQR